MRSAIRRAMGSYCAGLIGTLSGISSLSLGSSLVCECVVCSMAAASIRCLKRVPYIILYVVCVQSEEATVAYVRRLALAGDTAPYKAAHILDGGAYSLGHCLVLLDGLIGFDGVLHPLNQLG